MLPSNGCHDNSNNDARRRRRQPIPLLLIYGCCALVFFFVSEVGTRNVEPFRRFPTPVLHQPGSEGAPDGASGVYGVPWPPSVAGNADNRNADAARRLDDVKTKILGWTGMGDGPLNVSSRNRSGFEALFSAPEKFPGSWKVRPEMEDEADEMEMKHPYIVNEIKEFADEVPGLGDVTGVVQFVLHPKEIPGYDTPQRVVHATMRVLVRLQRSPGDRPKTSPITRRRITIVVYLLDNGLNRSAIYRMEGETAPQSIVSSVPIAQLTILIRRTKWHRVLLPTTIVQTVFDSVEKILCLRVVCLECNDDAEVVLLPRKRTGKQQMKKKKAHGERLLRTGGGSRPRNEEKDEGSSERGGGETLWRPHQWTPPSGEGKFKRSPVLIVRAKSSLRPRRTP